MGRRKRSAYCVWERAAPSSTWSRGFENRPIRSTNNDSLGSTEIEVGAHEFRNRFGWYMERAQAGEEFLVTRRGRPYVRLAGAAPQLPDPS
jgi:prevent-host-death family protein